MTVPPDASTFWSRRPPAVLTIYAAVTAFAVYFCMYAFRKPFDAATFTGAKFLGTAIELKTACVIAQVIGYMLSKYLGTKFCSEVPNGRRAAVLIGLIVAAEGALVLLGLVPADLKPLAMFFNGLPLGMVWGFCVRYLEGRRSTELLLAGLSCSFVIAGAVTRDVGVDLVIKTWGVTEGWMPAVTGGLFLGPFVLFVGLLNCLPPPTAADVAERSARGTMTRSDRTAFRVRYGAGFLLILLAYFLLTAFRDFRDHYGKELFIALDLADQRGVFTRTEKWAFFGVILALAGLCAIRNHTWALVTVTAVIVTGFVLIGGGTLLFQTGHLSGGAWMAVLGLGTYLAYVPFGAVLFERMMAASRLVGTSVFAIQLADGVGYTGSVLVQLLRDVVFGEFDRVQFLIPLAYVVAVVGGLCMTLSGLFIVRSARAGVAGPDPSRPTPAV